MLLMESVQPILTKRDMSKQTKEKLDGSIKVKRQKRTLGAVMEINIDNEYYVYAQSYPYTQEIIFDYRSKEPLKDLSVLLSAKQLFQVAVFRWVIGSGHWKKVGKLPLREDLLPAQMKYIYHKFDRVKFEIYNPETVQITPSSKEECRGLERCSVWGAESIKDRIRDHYNGVPCMWLEDEYEIFKD